MTSNEENDVILQAINGKGIVTLNRPKVLNALTLSMIQKIYPALKKWEHERSLVIVKGAGEKAFCAGSDVKILAEAGLKGDHVGKTVFREGFTIHALIGRYKIPYVALMDGITMGGGAGLSVNGKYRVATERTVFAMPEAHIGLFADAGASHFLSRLQGKLGVYLALTGQRLKGPDIVKVGLANYYCESSELLNLENELLECKSPHLDVAAILVKYMKMYKVEDHTFSLADQLEQIENCFSAPSVEEILQRLQEDGSQWALQTLDTLQKVSPTSLKVIYRTMDEGVKKSLQECLVMEYRLCTRFLESMEFYEGVRALLIDKDRRPQWNPPLLEDVTQEMIDQHFAPLPADDELKL